MTFKPRIQDAVPGFRDSLVPIGQEYSEFGRLMGNDGLS